MGCYQTLFFSDACLTIGYFALDLVPDLALYLDQVDPKKKASPKKGMFGSVSRDPQPSL